LPRRETLNSLKMAVAAIKAYVEYISPSHQPTTRRHGQSAKCKLYLLALLPLTV
jgi:hypothetical protein